MRLTRGAVINQIRSRDFVPSKLFPHDQPCCKEQTVTLPSRLVMAAAGRPPEFLPPGFYRFGGEVV